MSFLISTTSLCTDQQVRSGAGGARPHEPTRPPSAWSTRASWCSACILALQETGLPGRPQSQLPPWERRHEPAGVPRVHVPDVAFDPDLQALLAPPDPRCRGRSLPQRLDSPGHLRVAAALSAPASAMPGFPQVARWRMTSSSRGGEVLGGASCSLKPTSSCSPTLVPLGSSNRSPKKNARE